MRIDEGSESHPIWWRGNSAAPPASWVYMFEEFTGGDSAEQWALEAAIVVARVRKRTSSGPTFSELFVELMPNTNGVPGPLPDSTTSDERKRAINKFRLHAAIEWRRRGMIGWSKGVERSLRVERRFNVQARERRRWIVRELNRALGRTLVAGLTGADSAKRPQSVARHEEPRLRARQWNRLKFAHDAWTLLEAVEGRDVARRWFIGGNARLGGETPVMAIRNDRHVEVLSAVESFIQDDVDE
jgi:hypothetical protein